MTGLARHTIRVAAWSGASPAETLAQLNHAVLRSDRDTFCTALFCELYRIDGGFRITVTAGGHPLPVVRRADDATECLGGPGSLIGVFDRPDLVTTTDELRTDDTLMLYTDGVTDLPPPFGLDIEEIEHIVGRAGDNAGSADEVAVRFGDDIAAKLPLSARQRRHRPARPSRQRLTPERTIPRRARRELPGLGWRRRASGTRCGCGS